MPLMADVAKTWKGKVATDMDMDMDIDIDMDMDNV